MTTELASHFHFSLNEMVIKEVAIRDQEVVSFFKDFKEQFALQDKFEMALKVGNWISVWPKRWIL